MQKMKSTYNRSGWAIVAVFGLTTALGSALGTVLGFIYVFVTMLTELSGTLLQNGIDLDTYKGLIESFSNNRMVYDLLALGSVLGSAIGLGVGLLLMKGILPKDRTEPERWKLNGKEIFMMCLMAFGLWGSGALVGNLPVFFGLNTASGLEGVSDDILLIVSLYSILGAPLLEELVFRKMLLDATHRYGETVAVFTSALLFGLMHGNPAQFMLAFCLGLILASVYVKTGNVWYSILLHFMINLTASIPTLFGFLGIDVSLIWYLVVGSSVIAGIVTLFIYGPKAEFLKLKRPFEKEANRAAFKNPGMTFAVIGGIVLMCTSVGTQLIGDFSKDGAGLIGFVRLIPLFLTILTVLFVRFTAGSRTAYVEPVMAFEPAPAPAPVEPFTAEELQPVSYVVAEEAPVEPVVAETQPEPTAEEPQVVPEEPAAEEPAGEKPTDEPV